MQGSFLCRVEEQRRVGGRVGGGEWRPEKRIGIEGRERTGKNRQSRRSGGDAEMNERN